MIHWIAICPVSYLRLEASRLFFPLVLLHTLSTHTSFSDAPDHTTFDLCLICLIYPCFRLPGFTPALPSPWVHSVRTCPDHVSRYRGIYIFPTHFQTTYQLVCTVSRCIVEEKPTQCKLIVRDDQCNTTIEVERYRQTDVRLQGCAGWGLAWGGGWER